MSENGSSEPGQEPGQFVSRAQEAAAAVRGFAQRNPELVDAATNIAVETVGNRLGPERATKLGAVIVGLSAGAERYNQEPGTMQSGLELVATTVAKNRGMSEQSAQRAVRAAAGGWAAVQAGRQHLAAARKASGVVNGAGEAAWSPAPATEFDAGGFVGGESVDLRSVAAPAAEAGAIDVNPGGADNVIALRPTVGAAAPEQFAPVPVAA